MTLALAHRHKAWRVKRRLQPREHADFLLEETRDAGTRLIALEVSGVDRGSIASRLSEKLRQVAKTIDVDERYAGVIGFERPNAALRFTAAEGHGN